MGDTRKSRALLSVLVGMSMLAGMAIVPSAARAQVTSYSWGFEKASDYTYDQDLVDISAGAAKTRQLPLSNGWWTKNGPLTNLISFYFCGGVSCDPDGNPVVASSTGTNANQRMWVRKYDGTDGSTAWSKTFTSAWGVGLGVSCDHNGNPVVVGITTGGQGKVVKLNGTDGTVKWNKTYTNVVTYGVSCDPDGNPIVAGKDIGAGNIVVRKYKGSDGSIAWTKVNVTGTNDDAYDVYCDPDGNPVVAGSLGVNNGDIWVRKYNGTNGSTDWTKTFDSGGGNMDAALGVSCDAAGDPVVTGFIGTGQQQIWVRKYNGANGATRWTRSTTGGGPPSTGVGVSCDSAGDPVVAGTSGDGIDIEVWVRKYRGSDGSTVWTKAEDSGSGNDWAGGVSCDNRDNPVVMGHLEDGTGTGTWWNWVRKYPPGDYASSSPSVTTLKGPDMTGRDLTGFSHEPGSGNQGTVTYQLSPDGNSWYYYNSGWKMDAGSGSISGVAPKTNTASQVNNNIASFNPIASEKLYVRAFLNSDSMQKVVLEEISVDMTSPLFEWYLAEGTTAWGFSTYISIQNPNARAVTAEVTFMPDGAANVSGTFVLPASSQTTLTGDQIKSLIGEADFSTRVRCLEGEAIAVDRTMSWPAGGTGGGLSGDGHCSIGVRQPARQWYLAEGSSAWGFECWILVQNPNDAAANITLTYMVEGEEPVIVEKTVGATSRRTFNMAEDIGGKDASVMVEADVPVIPERAMYRDSRQVGTDSIGTTEPATDYYLAEGTTAWGFTTYVLIQNPNDAENTVNLTYMTDGGPVAHPGNPVIMPANSRKTLRVNDYLPTQDFSTHVAGSLPVIAERSMYWDGGPGPAGHDSIGLSAPHVAFYLPDGQTTDGRETWTLVQNPSSDNVTVDIAYLAAGGERNVTKSETIPAGSRRTFNMADHSGIQGRASVLVTCTTPGRKIMVERAMYWNSRGAGTGTIGGFSE